MKKFNLSLILIFFSILLSAQTSKVKWGKTFLEDPRGYGQTELFAADASGYYVQARRKKNNTLYKFDYNNQLIFTRPFVAKAADKFHRFSSFVETKSGTYGIVSYLGGLAKKKKIFTAQINDNGLENLKHLKTYSYTNPFNDNVSVNKDVTEKFILTKDSTRIVHFDILSTSDFKGGKEKFIIDMLDDTLGILWEKEIELPVKDELAIIENIFVGNNETVWVTVKILEKKKRTSFSFPDYQYNLLKITQNDIKTYKLKLTEETLISSVMIAFEEIESSLFLSGVFTDTHGRRYAKGLFSGYFDTLKGEISYISTHFFTETEQIELIPTNIINLFGGNENADFYRVKELISLGDGNYKTLVEYVRPVRAKVGSGFDYILRNLIIFNTDKNELNDINIISRSMDYYDERDAFFISNGDSSYLFFTHWANKEERKSEEVGLGTLFTKVLHLDSNNEIKKDKILRNSATDNSRFYGMRYISFGDKLVLGGTVGKYQGFTDFNISYLFGVYDLQ